MANITQQKALEIWIKYFGNVQIARDIAGAIICRDSYGVRSRLGYGWEIDHRIPESKDGSDKEENLRPLQWENNCSKSDNYPYWTSVVTSQNGHNVYKERYWTLKE